MGRKRKSESLGERQREKYVYCIERRIETEIKGKKEIERKESIRIKTYNTGNQNTYASLMSILIPSLLQICTFTSDKVDLGLFPKNRYPKFLDV